jgi:hypothetical protein
MAEKIDPKDPRAKLARSMSRIFAGTGKKDDAAVLLSYLTSVVAAPTWLNERGGFNTPEAAAFADGRRNLAFDLIGSGNFDVRNIRED